MKSHEVKLQLFSSYNRYILFHRMYSYEKIDNTVAILKAWACMNQMNTQQGSSIKEESIFDG